MAGGRPLRVAVVDDSAVVRRLVADALRTDPRIVEVRTANDGRAGVALVRAMRPDLVTMDVQMPVMDGIEAVKAIRAFDRDLPIIMFSTLTESGGRATLDAFGAGATDFVTKPAQTASISAGLQAVRLELIPKVLGLADRNAEDRNAGDRNAGDRNAGRLPAARAAIPGGAPAAAVQRRPRSELVPRLVAIGASTGGPEALATFLTKLPADLPVPIVVTQHMPAMFTRLLAERLNGVCKLTVTEAVDHVPLTPGTITIAPGGRHLVVLSADGVLRGRLRDTPPVNSCRPSVDTMFRSLSAAVGPAALAIVLTGMGSDGALGAAEYAATGGRVWAQDEASSVVWGMPGATVATSCVERVLPLERLADSLVALVTGSRRQPVAAAPALGPSR